MFGILRLFISLGTARLGELRVHTKRRVMYSALLGFFGLIALIFGLIAATVALTEEFGQLYALLMMMGGALFCALVVLILMKIAERKHRKSQLRQEELRARLSHLAMATAIGGRGRMGYVKMAGMGVVGLAALLAARGMFQGDEEE